MDPKDDKIFINPGDMAGDPIKEGSLEDDVLALARVGLHAAQHPMRRGARIPAFLTCIDAGVLWCELTQICWG